MEKLFNRISRGVYIALCACFLFSGTSVYAASSSHQKILTLAFSDNCTVNQKKSSAEVWQSETDSIEDILIDSFLPYEKKYSLLSSVCEFELQQNLVYTTSTTMRIVMQYKKTDYRPRLFFWNEEKKIWISVDTTINRKTNTASAESNIQKGIVGVFADESDVYEGVGSWYAHKKYLNGSATNLFPIGTVLKVTNLENNKNTLVTVTSTWTNTNKKRVIDLVSTAFKKIAPLHQGLIRIRIEKMKNV